MTDPDNLKHSFRPALSRGLIFHGVISLLLVGGGGYFFLLALEQDVGAVFIQYLLLSLALLAPLPVLVYRLYTLLQARYVSSRDGLRLRWGLRSESIPVSDIEWIRSANDLVDDLPLPRLNFTGFMQGKMEIEGLGKVEFMASSSKEILLVATPGCVFAISPARASGFLDFARQIFESGSPTPLEAQSIMPTMFFSGLWADKAARLLIPAGFSMSILLLVIVSLIIPGRTSLSVGFNAQGLPLPPGPPERLLLLPVLSLFFFFVDLLVGIFVYRHRRERPVAYLLWSGNILTPLLLMAAIFFML